MKIAEKIDKLLQKFDRVLVIINGNGIAENLTENFLQSEALQKTSKKMFILSDQSISDTMAHHQYAQLDAEEVDAIRRIYFTYDFSDHFYILSDSPQYGGLLNYVKTGIMTMEEVFETILR